MDTMDKAQLSYPVIFKVTLGDDTRRWTQYEAIDYEELRSKVVEMFDKLKDPSKLTMRYTDNEGDQVRVQCTQTAKPNEPPPLTALVRAFRHPFPIPSARFQTPNPAQVPAWCCLVALARSVSLSLVGMPRRVSIRPTQVRTITAAGGDGRIAQRR